MQCPGSSPHTEDLCRGCFRSLAGSTVGDAGIRGRCHGLWGLFPELSILVAGVVYPQKRWLVGTEVVLGAEEGDGRTPGYAVLGLLLALAPKEIAGPCFSSGLARSI